MKDPVSFELVKLLKEKKVDIHTYKKYAILKSDREVYDHRSGEDYVTNKKGDVVFGNLETILYKFYNYDSYNAPTIAEVVMWLYEKYGIWIEVYIDVYIDDASTFGYLISRVTNEGRIDSPLKRGFKSIVKSYEAAIKYVLENLIK